MPAHMSRDRATPGFRDPTSNTARMRRRMSPESVQSRSAKSWVDGVDEVDHPLIGLTFRCGHCADGAGRADA